MAKYDTSDMINITLPRSLYLDMFTKTVCYYAERAEVEIRDEIIDRIEEVAATVRPAQPKGESDE